MGIPSDETDFVATDESGTVVEAEYEIEDRNAFVPRGGEVLGGGDSQVETLIPAAASIEDLWNRVTLALNKEFPGENFPQEWNELPSDDQQMFRVIANALRS